VQKNVKSLISDVKSPEPTFAAAAAAFLVAQQQQSTGHGAANNHTGSVQACTRLSICLTDSVEFSDLFCHLKL
jgi:hypothetical protein